MGQSVLISIELLLVFTSDTLLFLVLSCSQSPNDVDCWKGIHPGHRSHVLEGFGVGERAQKHCTFCFQDMLWFFV